MKKARYLSTEKKLALLRRIEAGERLAGSAPKLVKRAEDWRWSSVRAHLSQRDDGVVATAPILERCGGDFAALIASEAAPTLVAALRGGETIGRPLGSPPFRELRRGAHGTQSPTGEARTEARRVIGG